MGKGANRRSALATCTSQPCPRVLENLRCRCRHSRDCAGHGARDTSGRVCRLSGVDRRTYAQCEFFAFCPRPTCTNVGLAARSARRQRASCQRVIIIMIAAITATINAAMTARCKGLLIMCRAHRTACLLAINPFPIWDICRQSPDERRNPLDKDKLAMRYLVGSCVCQKVEFSQSMLRYDGVQLTQINTSSQPVLDSFQYSTWVPQ